MKNLFYALISCFIVLSGVQNLVLAQAYDYARFRFPEVKLRALDGTLYLNGSQLDLNYTTHTNKLIDLQYSLSSQYYTFTNTKKNQNFSQWGIYNRYAHREVQQSFGSSGIIPVNKVFNLNFQKSGILRKYANTDSGLFGISNPFFEIGHHGFAWYDYSFSKGTNNENRNLNFNLYATLPVKMGYGRIEPMNDVFLAQFLMDDLWHSGLIDKKFSEEKLFELAALMSTLRNTRVFDFRRAGIYQLTELSSWMEKNNIPQNIKTFTILNDNWRNAFTQTRNHGKRLSLGLIPWVENQRYYYNGNVQNNNTNYGLGVQLEYTLARAVSQYTQRDLNISLSQHYQNTRIWGANQYSDLTMVYYYGYNPNSRTTWGVTPHVSYILQDFSESMLNAGLTLSSSYFINNKARIGGNFYLGYAAWNSSSVISIRYPRIFNSLRNLPGPLVDVNQSYFEGLPKSLNTGVNVFFNYAIF